MQQKGLKVTIGVTALQGAWWLDPHRCSGQCDLVLINLHSSPTTEAPARLTSGHGDQVAQAEGGGPVAGAPPVLVVRCWPPASLHTWLHVYAEPRPNPPWKSVILSEAGQCSVSDIWWDNGAPPAAAPRGSPNVGKVCPCSSSRSRDSQHPRPPSPQQCQSKPHLAMCPVGRPAEPLSCRNLADCPGASEQGGIPRTP